MKIFYWAPWIGNIGTIKAVLNSAYILNHYSKNEIKTKIINSVGEWEKYKDNTEVINLRKSNIYKYLPQGGFLFSRITYIIIFLSSFWSLKKLLKKEKPDFLIVQLITSLPLFLKMLFNLDTKLILRISGYPKMNFLRRTFWKIVSKKIHKITFPSYDLYKEFKTLNIFEINKMSVLYDPIISYREVARLKNENSIAENPKKNEYLLCIGRLTKQKNFSLLINAFKEITKEYPNLKLIILGEGEERKKLKKIIKNLNLEKVVFLEGYKKNIFNYLHNCECYISSSLYEDPGFTLIESGFLNKSVIAADSNTGPSEILNNSCNGFLFKNNDKISLIDEYLKFKQSNFQEVMNKKINLKKFSKNFSVFKHFQSLEKILSN